MLKQKDREMIRAAVEQAEKKTSGEIVPVVAGSSGDYRVHAYKLGVIGLVLFSLLSWRAYYDLPFFWSLEKTFLLQIGGFLLGFALGLLPPVLRLLARKSMQEEVHERATVEFFHLGLTETKARTGVLVYVSLLEHRVEIIADKGIHEKAGDGYWSEECKKIAAGIAAGNSGAALAQVIREIGEKLSEHFPRAKDDANELKDDVVLR